MPSNNAARHFFEATVPLLLVDDLVGLIVFNEKDDDQHHAEQGLNEDDIRRRDEKANIDRIHFSNHFFLERNVWTWCSRYWQKRECPDERIATCLRR